LISLSHLKQALAPLETFGKNEHIFQINGLSITIRPLLPVEETHVHRYAAEIIEENKGEATEDGNMSRAAALDYFDRFRIEVIAHAIIQIGGLDLRHEKTLATGEALEDGTPIKVSKASALRDMIRNEWSRTSLSLAFEAYGDLMQRLQDEADNIVRKSIDDLDIEIARLENRLVEVKAEREKRTVSDPTIFKDQVESILKADSILESADNAQRAEIQAQRTEAVKRESVIPQTAPPPGPPAPSTPPPQTTLPPENDLSAMRLPPQELSNRGKDTAPKGRAELNPSPKGELNPNFRRG
jgi:hypothetical protein